MNKLVFLLGMLVISCSCSTHPDVAHKTDKSIDLDSVKTILSGYDEIPVDSMHVVKLKQPGLYLVQGFGRVDNQIRLVKIYPDRFEILDSLQTVMEDDSFGHKKIQYDIKNDWFVSSDVGRGSGDLSLNNSLIRVEKNRFATLFSYTKQLYFTDAEASPVTYETVEVKTLEMNRKRILLLASYQMEYQHVTDHNPAFLDTVTFEFSDAKNKFIRKKSTNPALKDKWWPDEGEYIFRL